MVAKSVYAGRFLIYMIIVIFVVYVISEYVNKNNRKYPKFIKQGVNEIMDEAAKIATTASHNENDMLSLIQNTEAVTMMKTLQMLVSEEDVVRLTQVPFAQAYKAAKEQQSTSVKKLMSKCPFMVPRSEFAAIAGFYPNPPTIAIPSKSSSSSAEEFA